MREQVAVPPAEFRSYYGRQVLKSPVWNWMIAAYLFSGGLSAGSAMLAAGADLTGRPALRRVSRLGALASLAASMYFLVADLGRPERFHHMLRVAKPSSPMSMGTWILSAYGPGAGLAGAAELLPSRLRRTFVGKVLGWLARPAGLSAAAVAIRRRSAAGRAGGRHAGSDVVDAGLHACAWPGELVGACTAGAAAPAVRHQRIVRLGRGFTATTPRQRSGRHGCGEPRRSSSSARWHAFGSPSAILMLRLSPQDL
jgi:hypothetical protein